MINKLWSALFFLRSWFTQTTIRLDSIIVRKKLGKIGEHSEVNAHNLFIDNPKSVFIGDKSFINDRVKFFSKRGKIVIGNEVTVNSGVIFYTRNGTITIEDNVYINHDSEIIANNAEVIIKKGTVFGMNVLVVTSNYNFSDRNKSVMKQSETYSSISIGRNVWVGANSTILMGANLGDGVIVGAGSVVTKPVVKNTVIAGVPAKKIRMR